LDNFVVEKELSLRKKVIKMLEVTEDEIRYLKQLDERQQRLYVGLQAQKLGKGGCGIVSKAYGYDIKTVSKGKSELSELPPSPIKRIRKAGGGAKKK
jgi:tetrahydromethanopterin S-methyltransferase subunit F